MPELRSADELAVVDDPAWPALVHLITTAGVSVRVLDLATGRGIQVLHRFQVTARSTLGALALNCGGLVIDHGWVRVLGGGTDQLPDLAHAYGLDAGDGTSGSPPALVVAYDVLGGQFAIDGGGLGVNAGEVCYRGPDTLRWEGLGTGHGAFITALLAGGLDDFYAHLRWPGWEQDVQSLELDQGLSVYPPPFTAEGQPIAAASRRVVPFSELLALYDAVAAQLAELPDGSAFEFRFE
jgi:hypothetical protein